MIGWFALRICATRTERMALLIEEPPLFRPPFSMLFNDLREIAAFCTFWLMIPHTPNNRTKSLRFALGLRSLIQGI